MASLNEIFVSLCVRDKAGGYGIQALGGMLVEYVHGDFLNVVGFPLNHFCKQLDRIYNHCTSSSDEESLSVCLGQNSSHTPTIPTQPPPNLSTQSSHSPASSAKHNLSSGPRPNGPSASQTHHTQNSPTASPAHKVSFFLTLLAKSPFCHDSYITVSPCR